MRVVLDANVLISFLLTRGQTISRIVNGWRSDKFLLLVSDEILVEYKQTLNKFIKNKVIRGEEVESLLNEIIEEAINVQTISVVELSADREDNRYLACAKDGNADFLVTGDKRHLVPLKKFGRTKIISPKDFVNILK